MSKHKKRATKRVTDNKNIDIAKTLMCNFEEDYGFYDILTKFQRKEFMGEGAISICKTPIALALGGANNELDLIINPKTIAKCLSTPSPVHPHGHDLDINIFKYLVFELRNPVMLLKGSQKGSLVAVTNLKDKENRPIIVSIAPNRYKGRQLVNQITSAYGRCDFKEYLERQVRDHNIIAVNKNKANQMFQSVGLQLPIEETLISFDNSIAYTFENVKGFFGKSFKYFQKDDFKLNESETIAIEKFDELICKLTDFIETNEQISDMVKFFEYAGDDIYNSALWYQFLADKDYIADNESVAQLKDILLEAKQICSRVSISKDISIGNADYRFEK